MFQNFIFCFFRKKPTISLASTINMAKVKKGMAKEARDNLKIKDEEKLTKRTKTILDKEHAMIEKEKEAEKK